MVTAVVQVGVHPDPRCGVVDSSSPGVTQRSRKTTTDRPIRGGGLERCAPKQPRTFQPNYIPNSRGFTVPTATFNQGVAKGVARSFPAWYKTATKVNIYQE
uniref:Uncharacterized protein n=1 Tax=Branchiostoma floridae TaxID=7739 RepID=C3YMS8_BRAFL|eukprot:XP_002602407.1 hypothetical protein BRAFLDRAFT_63502 [Branchiostoma floridae]